MVIIRNDRSTCHTNRDNNSKSDRNNGKGRFRIAMERLRAHFILYLLEENGSGKSIAPFSMRGNFFIIYFIYFFTFRRINSVNMLRLSDSLYRGIAE